jgi:hypothetical protein
MFSRELLMLLLLGFFEVPVIVRCMPVFKRRALCLLAVVKSHVLQNQYSEQSVGDLTGICCSSYSLNP